MHKKKKVLIFSVVVMLVTVGAFVFYVLQQINHVEIDKSNEALGIKVKDVTAENQVVEKEEEEPNPFDNQMMNIALFGVDRRDGDTFGNADSTMILTVDFKNNKLKVSSLMRDMFLDVEGHGETKFTHAYSYGGPALAIKTINQNFGTDVRDYISVDFFTLEKIIDAIGGVEINVKAEEIRYLNKAMAEVAKIQKEEAVAVSREGLQVLNGKQAVAYARIRYVGNGDFERTERQRTVISQMIAKVKQVDKADLIKLGVTLLPYFETSLDKDTIMNLGVQYLNSGINDLEQDRFPRDGYWKPYTHEKMWVMKYDETATIAQLHEFIYGTGTRDVFSDSDRGMNESTINQYAPQHWEALSN